MNIYRISQRQNCGYDTYDSAVVTAESEEEAQHMHPDDYQWVEGKWMYNNRTDNHSWADPQNVEVYLIGVALPVIKSRVICASFNAG